MKEKISYAVGGIGHNLIYALFSGYLLIFYTDVFGLSAAFTSILFLVARIFDALNDPVMGILADKYNSRMGHYRVWLLRAAPVIAIAIILCFFVPNLNLRLSYVYCYVTYILLGMSFTCADIPYWSLPSAMTDKPDERNALFGAASIAGCLASGIGAVVVPMVVDAAPDHQTGYLLCAIVFAIIGAICYYICGLRVREKVEIHNTHYSLKTAANTIFKNKPLLILMVSGFFGNMAFQMKIAFNTYYGEYVLGDYSYITYLSAMLLIGMLAGSAITPALIRKLGVKRTMLLMLAFGMIISLLYYLGGYQSLVRVLAFSAVSAIVIGSFSVLIASMTADCIDYAEWHLHQRNEGIIMSTRTFITKLATAVAGALAAFLLDVMGYIPNTAQSLPVKNGIHLYMSLFAAIMYALALVVMLAYPITASKFEELQEKLKETRQCE